MSSTDEPSLDCGGGGGGDESIQVSIETVQRGRSIIVMSEKEQVSKSILPPTVTANVQKSQTSMRWWWLLDQLSNIAKTNK